MSIRSLTLVSVVVADYDEAIAWYAKLPGFDLRSDEPQLDGKRWVVVGPEEGTGLLLAKAVDDDQRAVIGKQAGGRVFLFLQSGDFDRDHSAMLSEGVFFEENPRHEPYGKVAVFRDLYGNRWDLIGPSPSADDPA